jgi:hypothetical protein
MARLAMLLLLGGVGMGALAPACLPRDRELGREKRTQALQKDDDTATKNEGSADKKKSKKDDPAAKERRAKARVDPRLASAFSDAFDRKALGDAWRSTSRNWQIEDGRLCGRSARNHPVWLAYRLPTNARIEFDAASSSPDGDIKAEFWGDGSSAASTTSYTNATSYLTIFGGWKNRYHVLARIDEHARDRKQVRLLDDGEDVRTQKVVPNQTYHFRVERRDGKRLQWYVNDMEIHSLDDPEPLQGDGHEHFGFNDWQAHVCFDNLTIVPLKD